ncbi:hypothetical protein [Alicyclobacillus fastidiosus]|uniref:Uncharacterized protein n=1 Tax=Alicyclobacillus fastidiosus TaxID=392011 RepID=A0ABV5AK62_9BACL|nr:hypothetical protein [Alicyclobacillus fastidiosus]WEH09281.1 hypothetical protein PYS47_21835 [Alicyclobacillus fastidiosus]
MKPCWVCKNKVKPNTRAINCELCHGRVVSPTGEQLKKVEERERKRKELERMMSSKDTYERRGGKVKQKRRATD